MKLTEAQFHLLQPLLPRQRGNVSMSNHQILNAILYVAENGCKWRALPKEYGNWNTVYVRMNRWAKKGVLNKIFDFLQREQIISIRIEAVSLDSTHIKVHPDGCGALKKMANNPLAKAKAGSPPNFIWLPHLPGMQ